MRSLLRKKQGHIWVGITTGITTERVSVWPVQDLAGHNCWLPLVLQSLYIAAVNINRPPGFTCPLADQCSIWRPVLTLCGRWQQTFLLAPQCLVIMIDIPSRHLIELRVFNQHRYWGPSDPILGMDCLIDYLFFSNPPVRWDSQPSTTIPSPDGSNSDFIEGVFPARCSFAWSHVQRHVIGLNLLTVSRQIATMCDIRAGVRVANRQCESRQVHWGSYCTPQPSYSVQV